MALDNELINKTLELPETRFVQERNETMSDATTSTYMPEKGKRQFGMENDTEGLFNVFTENVVAGSRNIAGSIAGTFGNTKFQAQMEAGSEMNLDYDVKDLKFDSFTGFMGALPDWLAQSTGQALPDVAGAIGAGALTGGAGLPAMVGSSAFSFVRMQGANYRMMRKWKPDADTSHVRAASMVLTALQSGIEQLGGLEATGANKLLGGKSVNEVADGMIKSAARNGQLNAIQKFMTSSKNRSASVIKSAFSEFAEEQGQGLAEIVAGTEWGDQEYTSDDLVQKLILDPMRALPAGGIMGGVFHSSNANGKMAEGMPQITPKQKNSLFVSTDDAGQHVLDAELMAKDDAMFAALEGELAPTFGKGAKAAVSQIQSLAYSLSFSAQVNYGESLIPSDFIKDLSTGFVDASIGQDDINVMNNIRMDSSISNDEKGTRILDFIEEKYGEDSSLYATIKGVGQIVEASGIADSGKDIIDTLGKYAPQYSKKRSNEWRSSLGERVASLSGTDDSPRSISWDQMGNTFSRQDIARMFIEEPIIKVGGNDYAVKVDQEGVSFMTASEYDGEFKDIVGEFIGLIEGERAGMTPTGGAELLAREKALHGILESKSIVNQILGMYDSRIDMSAMSKDEQNMQASLKERADSLERKKIDIRRVIIFGERSREEMSKLAKDFDNVDRQAKLIRQLERKTGERVSEKSRAISEADEMIGIDLGVEGSVLVEDNDSSVISGEEISGNEGEDLVISTASDLEKTTASLIEQFNALEIDDSIEDSGQTTGEIQAEIDSLKSETMTTTETVLAEDNSGFVIKSSETGGETTFVIYTDKGSLYPDSYATYDEAAAQLTGVKPIENGEVDVKDNTPKAVADAPTKKKVEARTKELEQQDQFEYNKFLEEIKPMVDALDASNKAGDRMASMQMIKKINDLYKEAGFADRKASLNPDMSGGVLFETATIQPSTKTVDTMSDREVVTEADNLGVIFNGFWEPMHWPSMVDPIGESSFTVEDGMTIAEALEAHRARQKSAADLPTSSGAGLFESNAQTVRGMYLPTQRTAVFFKGAGVNTVVHEFAHHAKSILPIEMQSDLLSLFNETNGAKELGWTESADEWFANSMSKWIVNKEQPFNASDKKRAGAFMLARQIIMTAYKDFNLSEETKAGLDEMFGDVPDRTAVFGAKQAMDSMIGQDPPTQAMVSALFAEKSGSRFDTKEYTVREPENDTDIDGSLRFDLSAVDTSGNAEFTKVERSQLNKKIHGIMGSNEAVSEFAGEIFGESFDSLSNLTDDEFAAMVHLSEINQLTNDAEMTAKGEANGQTIFEHTQIAGPRMTTERIKSGDSRYVKMMKALRSKLRNAGVAAKITISSMESIMKVLDDISDTGVWHNMISKPLNAARELRATLTEQNLKFFDGVIRKRGLNMRKIQRQKIDVGGYEYTKGEVAFMAVVNRMRPQDVESFILSNHADNQAEGRQLLKDCDAVAKGDTELTGFIDSIQDVYKEVYTDLARVYKEVTGKTMGKLDWYMSFVRINQWDDLDPVMSQLNSVTLKGNAQYKSSTKVMQERKGGGGGRIDISDPFSAAVRYINQASTYTAMAKTVKSVSTTLASHGVTDALKWKFGADGGGRRGTNWEFMKGILDDLVMGELFHDARIKPMSEGESIFRNWRTRYSMFALAGNVNTMVKQVLSFPLGVARSGKPIETTFRAAGQLLSIGGKAFQNSLTNAFRYVTGDRSGEGYVHVLAGTPVYENWSNYSQVLLNRHGNPETGEAQSYNFGGIMGIEYAGIPFGEAMMAGISAIDALTVGTLWQATFDSWVRSNKADGMIEGDAFADAAEKANAMIRDSQPPSLPQDRNLMQRGNEYVRSFFMFSGATMRQYEVFSTDIMGRSLKSLKALKSGNVKEFGDILFKGDNLQAGLMVQLGVGFLLPSVIAGILSRRRRPTEKELMYDILSYPFTALPFMRAISGMAVGLDTDGIEASSYIERAGIEFATGIEAACKAFYGDGWEGKNIQEAIDGLSFLIHAPKITGRIGSAGIINAIGEDDFLSVLKEDYIDPYRETEEL